jgi:hypothetical protein
MYCYHPRGGGGLTASSQAQDNPDEGYIPVVTEELPEGFFPDGPEVDEASLANTSTSLLAPSNFPPNPGRYVNPCYLDSVYAPANMWRCLRDAIDLRFLALTPIPQASPWAGTKPDTGNSEAILRRKNNFEIVVYDVGNLKDGDAVTLYFNNRQLGHNPFVLSHAGTRVSIPSQYITSGINHIEAYAVSEGSSPTCTVGIRISNVLHGGTNFYAPLKTSVIPFLSGEYTQINLSFPIVGISASSYPQSNAHAVAAIASLGTAYTALQTIDRPGGDARRYSSIRNYTRNGGAAAGTGQDLDEFPMAVFRENAGTAHVQPIGSSDNRGSGSSIRWQLTGLNDNDNVDFRMLP